MENEENKPIEITYVPALFHRRVLADVFDFLLFALFMGLFFLGLRGIVFSTSDYKQADSTIREVKLSSGIYIEDKDSGEIKDVTVYYADDPELTAKNKKEIYVKAIDDFIAYMGSDVSLEAQKKVQESYDSYRLDASMNYKGTALFIEEGGSIKENPSSGANQTYYSETAYAPFITDKLSAYLTTMIPSYVEAQTFITHMLIYVEIPVSFLLADIVVLYIPPLIFRRGRKTVGKLLYKIGRVRPDYLNLSFGRFTAEFALFGILILFGSLFSLGIPLIISFSLMAFSKKKQDFADYMLNIREVETDKDKIYYSKDEIIVERAHVKEDAVDFVPDDRKDT